MRGWRLRKVVKMRTCFISAPVNVDLSTLREILKTKRIQPILPFELELTTGSFQDQIEKAISRSDFVVAILTKERNGNVFFEIGYACAKGKRIVLIQVEEFELPFNLSRFVVIKAKFDDKEKLSESF